MLTALALSTMLVPPSAGTAWVPLGREFVPISAPSPADLRTSRFGSRTWRVRFRNGTPEISSAPQDPLVPPFAPEVAIAAMGSFNTQPSQVLRVGKDWFLAYYHGEFGGALWRFDADGSSGERLLDGPAYDLVRNGSDVLAATGTAAPFFSKPLRIHEFALRGGRWHETGHADFPYNIVVLTASGRSLYAMALMHPGTQTLVHLSLSGNAQSLWETGVQLSVSDIAVGHNGEMAVGARGYVVVLHHFGNAWRAQWYAPRDCVRYTPAKNAMQAVAARCVAVPGASAYTRYAEKIPAVLESSIDGNWLFSMRGRHLWHFQRGTWRDVATPPYDEEYLDVYDGRPLLSTPGNLSMLRDGAWRQIGPRVQCTTPFGIASAVAWCAGTRNGDWWATAIGFDGKTVTADLHQSDAAPAFAADPGGGAWFTVSGKDVLEHVTVDGTVTRVPLNAWPSMIASGPRAVWFSETDMRHYGFADARGAVHEFSSPAGTQVHGILPARRGAWLREQLANQHWAFVHVTTDGAVEDAVELRDADSGVVTSNGTLYARSTKWPVILQLSESGALSRYRLPCTGPVWMTGAPNNGLWIVAEDSGCSALIMNGKITKAHPPLERTIEYK